ncbi:hypothetical protein OAA39_00260 [bacterium]|nr:hypothetical protein [bacterium]
MKERKLTKPEAKAKERIVKDLKGAKADFKKRYGKDAKSVMYATATKRAKKVAEDGCGCGCGDSEINHTINELIEDLVYEELCKRGKAYIAARKRAGEKSSAYLSGRAVKVCKGQMKGAGGKRKKSYKRKNESLYNQLKPQVLNHLEELFNDPHFAVISEYNINENIIGEGMMSNLNLMAMEASSLQEFLDDVYQDYPQHKSNGDIKDFLIKYYLNLGGPIDESLKNWFKKENWVRIDTQGNIAGKCGTMPKGKATQRCLPRAKAQSLTKAQRRATARKKVRGSKKGKQFVKNTKKAKVSFKKK